MRIYYGKRRWVPLKCPKCGTLPPPIYWQVEYKKIPLLGFKAIESILYFNYLLRACYLTYEIGLEKKVPFWRIPRWYGDCGVCVLNDAIFNLSPFWTLLAKESSHTEWKGGTLTVPFI
jgi:hypothetical protein